MKGRKPKPTALKTLEGNPGKRRLNAREPKPDAKAPKPALTGAALAEWNRIAPEMEAIGILTKLDKAMLEMYCVQYARWKKAEEEIAKSSDVVKTKSGNAIHNPWIGICNSSMKLCHKFAAEFGFSPSSRSGIHAAPPVEEDDGLGYTAPPRLRLAE